MRVGVDLNQTTYGSSISGYSAQSELIPNTKNLVAALRSVSLSVRHAGSALSMACQNSGLWCGSDALPEVDLDSIARNFDGPEQANRRASGGL